MPERRAEAGESGWCRRRNHRRNLAETGRFLAHASALIAYITRMYSVCAKLWLERSGRGRGRRTFRSEAGSIAERVFNPSIIATIALLAVTFVAACGDGDAPTGPPPPAPARATTVTVSPATAELTALGATVQLSAEVRDQNGNVMTGASVAWSSGSASVASVAGSGLVTAAGNGTATITATAGSASGSATVAVAQRVNAVVVSPPADTMAAGDTLRLAAEALDGNGHPVTGAAFTWSSNDVSVASVDASGLVRGIAEGKAGITAEAGDVRGVSEVTVEASSIPSIVMEVGDRISLDVSAYFDDPDGSTLGFSAQWPAFEAGVPLTVTGALTGSTATIWAVDDGEADITFTAADNDLSVSRDVQVTTTPPAVPTEPPSLRVIYAIPSDREWRQPYSDAIRLAIEAVQAWYLHQLQGHTFAIQARVPEVCHLPRPESWFNEYPVGDWQNNAWARLREAILTCAPVEEGFDQDHAWLVYADILEECDPVHGTALGRGWNGITMIGGQDLRTLTDPTYVVGPHCYGGSFGRWFGGLAHELGHGFNLRHPPGCDEGLPTCDQRALMHGGLYSWPDTYLRAEDEMPHLLANRFIRKP